METGKENNQQVFIKNPIMHIVKLVFSELLYKKSASHSCSKLLCSGLLT